MKTNTGMMKAKVFPDPVFAAPRTSRPERVCGSEARWISLISVYLRLSPSLVFCDIGSCWKSLQPTYGENPPSAKRQTGAEGGGGGKARGLEPESGFPDSIQASRSSISSTSESLRCLRALDFLVLGFLIRVSRDRRSGYEKTKDWAARV